jgi:hypothetical protein
MEISANIRIRIGKNTRLNPDGYISFDHFTFRNTVLTCSAGATGGLRKAAVLVDGDGAQGLNLQFKSFAWILSDGDGFVWDNGAVDPHDYVGNLSFEDGRTEQSSSSAQWSFYVTGRTTLNRELRNVSWKNCNLDATCGGVYSRNARLLSLRDCNLSQVSGIPIIDADGFRSLSIDNVWTKASSPGSINVNGATQQFAIPVEAGYTHPHTAVWGEGAVVSGGSGNSYNPSGW